MPTGKYEAQCISTSFDLETVLSSNTRTDDLLDVAPLLRLRKVLFAYLVTAIFFFKAFLRLTHFFLQYGKGTHEPSSPLECQ